MCTISVFIPVLLGVCTTALLHLRRDSAHAAPQVTHNRQKHTKESCDNNRLYFNLTQKCYPTGKKGPCGELMVLDPMMDKSDISQCNCERTDFPECQSRPTIFWNEMSRCYFIFDQGPCQYGEWLVVNTSNAPKCEKIPCPAEYNAQRPVGRYAGYNEFVFSHENTCYVTETQGYCPEGQVVYFNATSFQPQCTIQLCSRGGATVGQDNICPDGALPDPQGGCEPNVDI